VTYIPTPPPPTLALQPSADTQGDTTSDDVLDLTGNGSPNTTITILDGSQVIGHTTSSSNGSYSYMTSAQSAGMHNYTAQEPTDLAGNTPVSSPLPIDILEPDDTCPAEL